MNLKKLEEQRAEKQKELKELLSKADSEERAMNDEENATFQSIEKEIDAIDNTIKAELRAKELLKTKPVKKEQPKADDADIDDDGKPISKEVKNEERAFIDYIKGVVNENRANLTLADNTAIIPSSIAKKIIKKVHDISPLYRLATRYNVKGDLQIPYYDETTSKITVGYATEFTALTGNVGEMNSIELKGYLAGALALISKSLVNNSSFDVVSFVMNDMAESISRFIEKELINGTTNKVTGLLAGITSSQTTTAASATAIIADELIDAQELVPDQFSNCVWIMSRSTRAAIRKLKDSDGNYLLNRDMSARWGYTLLGKDVYTTENMQDIATGETVIAYGDMSGLAVKLSEQINVEVLRETYATQHAIGVVGFVEFDAKVENAQKLAKLVMA